MKYTDPKTELEKDFFSWVDDKMKNYWDEKTIHQCVEDFCDDFELSDDLYDWICEVYMSIERRGY